MGQLLSKNLLATKISRLLYKRLINWLPIPREKTIWLGKPRGLKTEMLISPEKLISRVEGAGVGLSYVQQIKLPLYHYGINFQLIS